MPAIGYNPTAGIPSPTGRVPILPDPVTSALDAIRGNIGNLGSIYNLGSQITSQNAANAAAQYRSNLPGYDRLTGLASQNIESNLEGLVGPATWAGLTQHAAERGIRMGSPGSPNANTALLRALGLDEMALQKLGQEQLTAAIGRTPTGPVFDPMSMLVSPGDVQSERAYQQIYNAAPTSPSAATESGFQAGLRAAGGGGGGINVGSAMGAIGYNPSGISWPGTPEAAVGPVLGALGPFDTYRPTTTSSTWSGAPGLGYLATIPGLGLGPTRSSGGPEDTRAQGFDWSNPANYPQPGDEEFDWEWFNDPSNWEEPAAQNTGFGSLLGDTYGTAAPQNPYEMQFTP